MKNQRIIDTILFLLIAFILYLQFKEKPTIVQHDAHIVDSIIRAEKEKLKNDSILLTRKIDSLNTQLKKIKIQRRDERINYEQQIAKLSAIAHDSVFSAINDSIEKMLGTMRHR
jgi:hypothetical protein